MNDVSCVMHLYNIVIFERRRSRQTRCRRVTHFKTLRAARARTVPAPHASIGHFRRHLCPQREWLCGSCQERSSRESSSRQEIAQQSRLRAAFIARHATAECTAPHSVGTGFIRPGTCAKRKGWVRTESSAGMASPSRAAAATRRWIRISPTSMGSAPRRSRARRRRSTARGDCATSDEAVATIESAVRANLWDEGRSMMSLTAVR